MRIITFPIIHHHFVIFYFKIKLEGAYFGKSSSSLPDLTGWAEETCMPSGRVTVSLPEMPANSQMRSRVPSFPSGSVPNAVTTTPGRETVTPDALAGSVPACAFTDVLTNPLRASSARVINCCADCFVSLFTAQNGHPASAYAHRRTTP